MSGDVRASLEELLTYVDDRLDEHERRHPSCRCEKWVDGKKAVAAVRAALATSPAAARQGAPKDPA